MSLLTVENLSVSFPTPKGRVNVVDGVSFEVGQERLGIVGESGSGKSMTGRAILRLIRPPGRVEGRMTFKGQDLGALSERQMRQVRGARISMIMQDPRYSLNPVMTVGAQIAEALRTHERLPRREVKARVRDMLEAVKINDPDRVARMYAHELSGGMGQRVMIAMMLIPRPRLLIADEPTSALDVSVQGDVLALINDLVGGSTINPDGMGLILISHDLPLVARYCDRILVMNSGRVVETCDAKDLHKATHPYTRGLLAAVPKMHELRDELPVMERTT
ncbi:ABC transporter ATP-binding protein [Rhodobacteraceae bacterium N5(2021)]|uniref:ABC transporter ATP-binding protein n=1 Tax=Gymnodinialimonas phycosphaerae TaxID=2841589 RepID=A0A975TRS4_9RHOB|nr:ABC transporter ATP-binding protein [Gymnodinialimonas phycosphaerae]MBY4893614.1 ABC transporter ATP-binding protein [Gymnodinialimonas phycosphaerae]